MIPRGAFHEQLRKEIGLLRGHTHDAQVSYRHTDKLDLSDEKEIASPHSAAITCMGMYDHIIYFLSSPLFMGLEC